MSKLHHVLVLNIVRHLQPIWHADLAILFFFADHIDLELFVKVLGCCGRSRRLDDVTLERVANWRRSRLIKLTNFSGFFALILKLQLTSLQHGQALNMVLTRQYVLVGYFVHFGDAIALVVLATTLPNGRHLRDFLDLLINLIINLLNRIR